MVFSIYLLVCVCGLAYFRSCIVLRCWCVCGQMGPVRLGTGGLSGVRLLELYVGSCRFVLALFCGGGAFADGRFRLELLQVSLGWVCSH